jgi:hypothetical protein
VLKIQNNSGHNKRERRNEDNRRKGSGIGGRVRERTKNYLFGKDQNSATQTKQLHTTTFRFKIFQSFKRQFFLESELKFLKENISQLLSKGKMRPSNSPYSSAIMLTTENLLGSFACVLITEK